MTNTLTYTFGETIKQFSFLDGNLEISLLIPVSLLGINPTIRIRYSRTQTEAMDEIEENG